MSRPAHRAPDLLRAPLIGPFLRWEHGRTVLQSILLLAAALVVVDGLFGPPMAERNLAGTLPWVHWRGLIVLALLVAGNFFCMSCPFMLVRRLSKRLLPGRRPWPRALRTKWLAAALLLFFFWAYEAFDLWASPWLTAWIVVAYFAAAFVIDGFFRGAAFCKHVCPIGQFNFVNGLASPAEVRVRDAEVCGDCRTKDCIRGRHEQPGTEAARPIRLVSDGARLALADSAGGAAGPRRVRDGCQLWLFQPRKRGNMDCTFCLDCVQACPHDNVGIVYRTPGRELWEDPRRSGVGRFGERTDLAVLALLVVFAAFVNAFGMVEPVGRVHAWLSGLLGTGDERVLTAAVFLIGLVAVPAGLVSGAAALTRNVPDEPGTVRGAVRRWAWALVPIGFAMWLAHYLLHFLMGALAILPALSERTGVLSGAVPPWMFGPAIPEPWLLPLQLLILEAGLLGSLYVAWRIGIGTHGRNGGGRRRSLRAMAPWALLALGLALGGMWLLAQPMEMRGMAG